MTGAEYNLFISDLYERVTAGAIDRDGAAERDPAVLIASEGGQSVLRYFFTKLVIDGRARPVLHGPVPSGRLLRILRAVADGLSNKQIASLMGCSEQLVKTHVSRLFKRCGCPDRLGLALWVREHSGWLEREIHAAGVLETSNVNGVVFSDQVPSSDNMSTF
jgi:DNA-binding CsgD family transcriptional regulator